MTLNLALFTSADEDRIEQELLAYFVASCPECAAERPARWYLMCSRHAPVVRSFLDPEYLPSLRQAQESLRSELEKLEKVAEILRRIIDGKAWVKRPENKGRVAAATARIVRLVAQIPSEFQDWKLEQIEAVVTRRREYLDRLTQHLQQITDAGKGIEKAITEDPGQ